MPEGRTKPWGTGQAVLAAKKVIDTSFIVINADDYYGKEGFKEFCLQRLGLRERTLATMELLSLIVRDFSVFNWRGIELTRKPVPFSNSMEGFNGFYNTVVELMQKNKLESIRKNI